MLALMRRFAPPQRVKRNVETVSDLQANLFGDV
jgi:hypothetical protein